MYTYWELANSETSLEGFDIKLYITHEYSGIDWNITEEEKQKVIEDINKGKLIYFIARVVASKNDIELSSDILGGCCYPSIEDFLNDDYYKDMIDTAIKEAKQTIINLCKDYNND